jgi:hypothetical protein
MEIERRNLAFAHNGKLSRNFRSRFVRVCGRNYKSHRTPRLESPLNVAIPSDILFWVGLLESLSGK